ncbi:cysteine desulfurase family protein [Paenibacillus thermoaerophilus]|nr:cysteine desulfurase family protein [Paenibacillus thermoaerophilus]
MLYMDHCSTTPPREEVVRVYADVMKSYFGNPSSLHGLGAEAEKLVRKSREVVAKALGVDADEIVFTSGGTESNHLAILGAVRRYGNRGRHLVTSAVEHASVLEVFRRLEQEGWAVDYVPVDRTGVVDPADVERALRPDTVLVSIQHVNNELGSVQPIGDIAGLVAAAGKTLFHVDAVQSLGKLPIRPREARIDLMSFSAHKIRGPKGVGFLYKRRGLELTPLFVGGKQERGLRAGTENVPGIVAAAKAVRMAVEEQKAYAERVDRLRRRLRARLAKLPGVYPNGPDDDSRAAPHVVNVSVPGHRAEIIVHALEQERIYISTRSACSSGDKSPSHVLTAAGLPREAATNALRVGLGAEHTEQDVDKLVDSLARVLASGMAAEAEPAVEGVERT